MFRPARKIRLGIPGFFLLAAVALHFLYLQQLSPLRHYWHSPERILHVAELAQWARGNSQHVPARLLAYVLMHRPEKISLYTPQCAGWNEQLGIDLCAEVRGKKWAQIAEYPALDQALGPSVTVDFRTNFNPASYPAVAYLPHMLAAWIAWIAQWTPLQTVEAIVHSSDFAGIALGFAALRLLPVLQLPVAFLLLVPSVISMRIFPMPDGLLISVICLFTALILRWRLAQKRLTRWQKAGLAVLALWIGMAKLAYFWIAGLVLLLGDGCFENRRQRRLFTAGLLALAWIAALGWGWYSASTTFRLDPAAIVSGEKSKGRNNLAQYQLREIFLSPQDYATEVAYAMFSEDALEQYIGLGWNRPNLSQRPVTLRWLLFMPLLIGAMLPVTRRRVFLSGGERAWCLGLYYLSFITVLTLNFLFIDFGRRNFADLSQYNQGRYFLPLVPVFMLVIVGVFQLWRPLRALIRPLHIVAVLYSGWALYLLQKIHLGF